MRKAQDIYNDVYREEFLAYRKLIFSFGMVSEFRQYTWHLMEDGSNDCGGYPCGTLVVSEGSGVQSSYRFPLFHLSEERRSFYLAAMMQQALDGLLNG